MSCLLKILIVTVIVLILIIAISCCLISGKESKRENKTFDNNHYIKGSNK